MLGVRCSALKCGQKKISLRKMAETPTPPTPKDIQPKRVNAMVSLLTGAICGGIECIVVWPTENIKTQLQLQGRVKEPKFTSFSGGVKYVVSNHGIRALYKGLPPILLGVLPKSGIRFGTQAFLKQKMLDSNTQLPSNIINLLSGEHHASLFIYINVTHIIL